MDKSGTNKITRADGSPYKVIGTNPQRLDGVDKVTGRAVFGADIRLPGMLYDVAVLRSPHAHARRFLSIPLQPRNCRVLNPSSLPRI